jgi:dihydroxy-acid dehydratase
VEVSDVELARRRAEWKQPKPTYPGGAMFKYASLVGPACKGAVTSPAR